MTLGPQQSYNMRHEGGPENDSRSQMGKDQETRGQRPFRSAGKREMMYTASIVTCKSDLGGLSARGGVNLLVLKCCLLYIFFAKC